MHYLNDQLMTNGDKLSNIANLDKNDEISSEN